MQNTRKKITKKEKIIKVFNNLFCKYSKKLTPAELLQVAEDIVTATYKSNCQKHGFGKSIDVSDYFSKDAFQMITESPWEVAVREADLIVSKDYQSSNFMRFIWKK